MKAAQALRENGSITKDTIMIFDDIHIKQTEENADGENFGCNKEGPL